MPRRLYIRGPPQILKAESRKNGSPANSRGLTQNFPVLLSAILSIKRRFLLHFLKKVHKNVGSRTYQSALVLLTSRSYAYDILRSLRALPLTTGRNAWAWHDSLRSNMYHAFSCALLGSSLCRATLPFRFQRRITFAVYSTSRSNPEKATGTVRETAESPAGGRPLCEDCLSAVRV